MKSVFTGSDTDGKAAFLLFLFFLALYIFTSGGHFYTSDGMTFFHVADKMLDCRAPDLPDKLEPFGTRGLNNRLYSKFGLGQSLLLLPFMLPGRAASQVSLLLGEKPAEFGLFAASFANQFVSAVFLAVFYLLLRLFFPPGRSFFLVMAAGCSTFLWPYSKYDFAEPGASLFLLCSLYMVLAGGGTKRLFWAGALCGAALLFRIDFIFLAPLPLLCIGVDKKGLGAFAGGFLLPLSLLLYYNYFRYGSLFKMGVLGASKADHFRFNLAEGFTGMLFSPGKSVFLYNPPVAAALLLALSAGKITRRRLLYILPFAAYFLMHCSWHSWMGGWSWGPRRLYPAVPALLFACGFALDRGVFAARALLFLSVAGILVQLDGLSYEFGRYLYGIRDNFSGSINSISYSPLYGHLKCLLAGFAPDYLYLKMGPLFRIALLVMLAAGAVCLIRAYKVIKKEECLL